jgi:hypothetical protein
MLLLRTFARLSRFAEPASSQDALSGRFVRAEQRSNREVLPPAFDLTNACAVYAGLIQDCGSPALDERF